MFGKTWRLLLLAIIFVTGILSIAAWAEEPMDLHRIGSIQIHMQHHQNPVSGGTLTLYPVGTMTETGGELQIRLTDAFADSGISLDETDDPALAEALASYADERELSGLTQDVTAAGSVRFEELLPGVYLLVQKTAANGFEVVKPFLVRVPRLQDGVYHYDVEASPKMIEQQDPVSESSADESTSADSSLPQTGQLNWPVPILALSGLALLSCGWMLYFGKKRVDGKT